jgi:selenocysteine lyase/cysteine desulfurase
LIYNGISIAPHQEIITTEHDHYSTEECLRLREKRTGIKHRRVKLYSDPLQFDPSAAIAAIIDEIRTNTSVIAITWVQSLSGIKFPIKQLTEALAPINAMRNQASRILLCVDGVHGLGIENHEIEKMGCDFFVAGTHKWLFGPRGTGIALGKTDAWQHIEQLSPNFSVFARKTPGRQFTAVGFHNFEHRWALNAAFDFHAAIGKQRIQERIHQFATYFKAGLLKLPNVELMTPIAPTLPFGFVCFQIKGMDANTVIARLEKEHRILASSTLLGLTPMHVSPQG